MSEFLIRLKQRKLVQWALAYVAAAWAVLQALDLAVDSYDWPHGVMRIAFAVIALGFVIALVLAWYHGERGAQRVSGAELLLIALVLAIGGGLLWRFERAPLSTRSPDIAQVNNPDAAQRNPGRGIPDSIAGAIPSGLQKASSASAPVNSPGSQATAIPAKSVAVLPFVNMSGDAKNDYFSDGITEEILNALAQVPNLKVAARTSAFAFKGKEEDLRKVGQVLDVATVLEGSVQKSGDEVRITAQLIDARSGYHLWSEKYDRKLTNIFAVEDEISKAITEKLQVQLSGGAKKPLIAQKTIDPLAHDFYLRGLSLLAARGTGLRDAVAAFQSAVRIAPQYADAWGALAEAQALYPDYALGTMQATNPSALADAQHALSLNPDLASAYVAQGMVYKNQWRWPEADQAFRRAVSLAPGDAEALNQQAQFLLAIGQFNSALAEIEHAQRLDPLSPSIGDTREYLLMILGRYEAASAQLQRTLVTHPDFVDARIDEIDLAVIRHNYADAERQARLLAPLVGIDPDLMASWVHGIADPALQAAAVRSLETAPGAAHLRRDPLAYAHWLALLGARDRALAVLERLPTQRNSPEPDWMWDTAFDPIRNDPRFKAVLEKMGLPYTPATAPTP